MNTLQDKIKNAKLTKKERLVADFILHNKSTACFMTATDIAQELKVSDSSIVRFSRTLGFSGFNQLKRFLQNEVAAIMKESLEQSLMTPSERLERQVKGETDKGFEDELDKAIAGMKEVLYHNSQDTFDRALEILQNSRHKYIMGFRTASTVAAVLGYQLNVLLPGVHTSTDADARAIESLVNLGPEDCVVIVSFPRHGKMSRLVHAMALEKGAKIIAITDKVTSPPAAGSDVVFTADIAGTSYFNSVLPATFLAEAICTALCKKYRYQECKERLDLINAYIAPDEFF